MQPSAAVRLDNILDVADGMCRLDLAVVVEEVGQLQWWYMKKHVVVGYMQIVVGIDVEAAAVNCRLVDVMSCREQEMEGAQKKHMVICCLLEEVLNTRWMVDTHQVATGEVVGDKSRNAGEKEEGEHQRQMAMPVATGEVVEGSRIVEEEVEEADNHHMAGEEERCHQ